MSDMLPRGYSGENCSVARALEVVGDRWTLLLVRDALIGITRFEDFQRHLGMATNVLTDRLARLVEEDVLQRSRYQRHPDRYEYLLTPKGRNLYSIIGALMSWGDKYYAPNGPPLLIVHDHCGGAPVRHLTCTNCGESLGPDDVAIVPGPAGDVVAAELSQ